jgi:hypothetical protein
MDVSIEKQTEINEWSYNSKRDTLFFFQLVFIGLTILIIMYSLLNAGILNNNFVIYVMIIIFILLVLIWYSKYKYTSQTRDKQHWNRRNFSEDGNKPSPLPATVLSSIATSTAQNCSKIGPSGRPSGNANTRRESNNFRRSTRRSNNYDSEYSDNYALDSNGNIISLDDNRTLRIDSLRYLWGNSNGSRNRQPGYGTRDRTTFGPSGIRFNTPDGRLGFWDTTGEFDDYDDVSSGDLNEQQGRISNSLRNKLLADEDRYLSEDEEYSDELYDLTNQFSFMTLQEIIDYCEVNKGANFPGNIEGANMDDNQKEELIRKLGGPRTGCNRLLCTVNPNRSMKSPTTNVDVPCKELYPNLK